MKLSTLVLLAGGAYLLVRSRNMMPAIAASPRPGGVPTGPTLPPMQPGAALPPADVQRGAGTLTSNVAPTFVGSGLASVGSLYAGHIDNAPVGPISAIGRVFEAFPQVLYARQGGTVLA